MVRVPNRLINKRKVSGNAKTLQTKTNVCWKLICATSLPSARTNKEDTNATAWKVSMATGSRVQVSQKEHPKVDSNMLHLF